MIILLTQSVLQIANIWSVITNPNIPRLLIIIHPIDIMKFLLILLLLPRYAYHLHFVHGTIVSILNTIWLSHTSAMIQIKFLLLLLLQSL